MSDYSRNSGLTGSPKDSSKPMILSGNPSGTSYSNRLKIIERWSRCKWITIVCIIVLVLLFLSAGACFLIATAFSVPLKDQTAKEITPAEDVVYKFEYMTDKKRREAVVINVKMNYTEMFAEDMTIYNHFDKGISLYRVDIGPDGGGIGACLVKKLGRELPPGDLKHVLPNTSQVKVNSSELYVVSNSTPPTSILQDMRVLQFCYKSKVYMLEKATERNQFGSMTMEELLTEAQYSLYPGSRVKRDNDPYNPLDKHNNPPYYCGGPIGTGKDEPVVAKEYTCSRSKEYCYKSLVDEQCDECYHGHYLRTPGCWCPIQAIETCVRISYKPDKRICCYIDQPPCSKDECEFQKIPDIPIPVITFKIIPH